ncbi:TonB-dependent receptor plug domain-containing protein [Chitinophaga sp. Cy-1792]|uniref:TonB-dependent receptor plug domain-containing protein n=1 Tax=Chitinophaga sp. Cy-1792 TaxID=2608339 RepID=UPI00141E3B81|nr:TonB-dependent receptor plug domain-containing protein [Chitinophaga sp. Cy-1792]NIG55493.1 TonB-dependent receptor plug domain-containing protein [Chitinophaga sp. Cy-1792]
MRKYCFIPVWMLLTTVAVAQQKTTDLEQKTPVLASGADTVRPKQIIICGPSRSTVINSKVDSGGGVGFRCCRATISSDQPLYVLNGKVRDSLKLETINPNDILSISVLKGDTIAAIYGARGAANGVIIIDTKPYVNSGLYDLLSKYSKKYKAIGNCPDCTVYIQSDRVIKDEEKAEYLRRLQQGKIGNVEVVEQPALQQQYNITGKKYGIITSYKTK